MTIEAFGKLMNMESQAQQEDSTQVKAPSEFKPGSKWKPFKEGAIAYFNSIKTKSMIPLSYVIRDQAQPDPDGLYDSKHQRLIAVTPLEGIFDYLKSWTLNGPAWTWMHNFNNAQDGRRAWLALLAHFEGDAQKDRIKDNTYASIQAAKYYGEKKKFSFETYVTIHQEAYEDLEQCGEHVSKEKRCKCSQANSISNSTSKE